MLLNLFHNQGRGSPIGARRRGGFSLDNVSWLIRDEFTDTRAAGAVNGTSATPGPGTRAATDTDSKLTVGSDMLNVAPHSTPAWGDPGLWYEAIASSKNVGVGIFNSLNIAAGDSLAVGWDINTATTASIALWFRSGPELRLDDASIVVATWSTGTAYKTAIIANDGSNRFYYFIKVGANWKLLFEKYRGASDCTYPAITNNNTTATIDYIRVAALPTPFNVAYGLATQRLSGARSAGDTFSHEADFVGNFVVDTLPSDQIEMRFRVQDASNYWQVTVDSTGALDLDEVVSGSATQRGTAAGVVVNGEQVTIIADGETISVFDSSARRINYTSAANFKTATSGELETEGTGGAVTDIVMYPRTLSGGAKNVLDNYSANT